MNIKDIEVGMYVRIVGGFLGKVKKLGFCVVGGIEFEDEKHLLLEKGQSMDGYVTKASHNIIDVIEVGDYVNGMLVDEIVKGDGVYCRMIKKISDTPNKYDEIIELYITESDIKSIVTKEYFERGEFKP